FRIERPEHGDRIDSQRQRPHLLLVRREWMRLENQLMVPGFPILIEFVVKRLAALARIIVAMQFLAVRVKNEPAFVVVELIVHETLIRGEVEEQLVTPGEWRLERVRNRGGVVI